MLAYTFSFIFIAVLIGMAFYYQKQSKPTQLYVNPKSAKNFMYDKYWEVEQMQAGVEKEHARRQWSKECYALQEKLGLKARDLSVKVVD